MPDLTPPAPLFQHGTDADLALALVLERHGPTTILLPDGLDSRERYEVVAWRTVDDPDALTLEARRRETYGERLTRLLAEAYDRDDTSHAEDAARILEALGSDPDRLAP